MRAAREPEVLGYSSGGGKPEGEGFPWFTGKTCFAVFPIPGPACPLMGEKSYPPVSTGLIIYSPVQPGACSNQVQVIEILFIVTKHIQWLRGAPSAQPAAMRPALTGMIKSHHLQPHQDPAEGTGGDGRRRRQARNYQGSSGRHKINRCGSCSPQSVYRTINHHVPH